MSDLTDRLRCFDRQTCTEAAERIETLEAELAAMRAGGEPVAWLSVDCIGERYLCFTRPDDDDPVRPLVFGDTAPQAVREPLTDDQVVGIIASIAKNAARQPILFAVALARAIEAAHGIKGDSHGLPT